MVAGGHEASCRPTRKLVAGQVRSDHYCAGRHRLEQHDAKGLPAERRRHEHVRAREARSHLFIVDGSEPLDAGL